MRKICIFLLGLFLLVGCQTSQSTSPPQKEETEITFHQLYEHHGISFEFIDMNVNQEIYPANTNFEYDYVYCKEDTQDEMLDLVVRFTNKTGKSLKPDEDIKKAFLEINGKMINVDYYIENKPFTNLEIDASIANDQTVLLHFNTLIDAKQKEEELKLSFYLDDQKYVLNFSIQGYEPKKQTIELNQILDIPHELSMKFDDLGIFNQVLPDDTSGEYTYYELEDKKNLFLYGSCDFENKTQKNMLLGDLPSLRVCGQKNYLFMIAKQTKNKRDFEDHEDVVIKKGEKCRIFYYVELPKEVFFNDIFKKQKIDISYQTGRYLLKIPE